MWRAQHKRTGGPSNHGAEHRLPLSLPPEIWAWSTGPASSDGYKESLDLIADQSNFGFLSTKAGSAVTSLETHAHVKRIAEYVHSRDSNDQTLTVDPNQLRCVFQGLLEKDKAGKNYGQFAWRIGMLTPAQ